MLRRRPDPCSGSRRAGSVGPETADEGLARPHLPYPSRSNGQRTRLLRDPRGQARGERRRDQAVVPAAGPEMASGRQHRRGSGRAVQGAQRGVPGAVRSARSRHTTCSAGPASLERGARRGRGDFAGFGDIFDAFFGGAAGGRARRTGPAAGADLRYDLRITFAEAIQGTEKEIEFSALGAARRVRARAPSRARRASPAPSATAAARSGRSATRCSARWSTCRPARGARARARSSRPPARRATARVASSAAGRSASRSRPASTKVTRSGCPARARSGSGAACRQPVRGGPVQPHPVLKRDGTELFLDQEVSIVQAALGRP